MLVIKYELLYTATLNLQVKVKYTEIYFLFKIVNKKRLINLIKNVSPFVFEDLTIMTLVKKRQTTPVKCSTVKPLNNGRICPLFKCVVHNSEVKIYKCKNVVNRKQIP